VAREASLALSRVFGISSLSPALQTTADLGDIASGSLSLAASALRSGNSFAVRCRRTGSHPYTSLDVCREVGRRVLAGFPGLGLRVDLEGPDVELGVEVRGDHAFVYTATVEGAGGLPLGTQPKVVGLLSGGMDSPVACWLVMKRGCPVVPVYFDNTPFTDEATTDRVVRVAEALFEWAVGLPRRLHVVPHGPSLAEIREKCPERLTCLLCKRMMYRVAERIADAEGADGIVTGEALGEQASQTLRNLRVLTAAAGRYPIHRPLLGFDKAETERLARKIGTYEPSTRRAGACTAVPRRPATSADPEKVAEAERALDIEGMVETALGGLRTVDF